MRFAFTDAPVLVTGASGFIGSNLARRLLQEQANVHLLIREQSDLWRLEGIVDQVHLHRVDLGEASRLRDVVAAVKPSAIYHCAAFGGYPDERDPQAIMEANVRGTVNLLQAAAVAPEAWVINTGSSSEYGIKSAPMKEDDRLEPINVYGVTKAAATLFCQMTARATRQPIVTARLFSPYGPYEDSTRLIPSVIRSCLLGQAPDVTSGEQVRDFIFIDDVVDCYLQIPGASLQPVEVLNVGSGRQTSVREVIQRIVELCGASVQPRWGAMPRRPNETTTWVADLSKITSSLGWRPATSLDEGLRKTIAWFTAHMSLYASA